MATPRKRTLPKRVPKNPPRKLAIVITRKILDERRSGADRRKGERRKEDFMRGVTHTTSPHLSSSRYGRRQKPWRTLTAEDMLRWKKSAITNVIKLVDFSKVLPARKRFVESEISHLMTTKHVSRTQAIKTVQESDAKNEDVRYSPTIHIYNPPIEFSYETNSKETTTGTKTVFVRIQYDPASQAFLWSSTMRKEQRRRKPRRDPNQTVINFDL